MKEEGNYKIVENKDAHCSAVTQKQRKIKFKPKTKLNHNIYNIKSHVIPASATKAGITEVSLKCHPVLRPTLQLEARKEPGLVTRWGGGLVEERDDSSDYTEVRRREREYFMSTS